MVLLHQVVAVGEKRHIELKSLGCFEKKDLVLQMHNSISPKLGNLLNLVKGYVSIQCS